MKYIMNKKISHKQREEEWKHFCTLNDIKREMTSNFITVKFKTRGNFEFFYHSKIESYCILNNIEYELNIYV